MKRRVIYVAGPFRAKVNPEDQWEQTQNIRRAEELALEVWRAGHVAVCPHLNTLHFQGTLPDKAWLDGDLEILRRCDAVLLAPLWETSDGTKREIQEAFACNIPVGISLEELLVELEKRDRPPETEVPGLWVCLDGQWSPLDAGETFADLLRRVSGNPMRFGI